MKMWNEPFASETDRGKGRKRLRDRPFQYYANIGAVFNASDGRLPGSFAIGPHTFNRVSEGLITSFPVATVPHPSSLSYASQCLCFHANGVEGYQHLSRLLWLFSTVKMHSSS